MSKRSLEETKSINPLQLIYQQLEYIVYLDRKKKCYKLGKVISISGNNCNIKGITDNKRNSIKWDDVHLCQSYTNISPGTLKDKNGMIAPEYLGYCKKSGNYRVISEFYSKDERKCSYKFKYPIKNMPNDSRNMPHFMRYNKHKIPSVIPKIQITLCTVYNIISQIQGDTTIPLNAKKMNHLNLIKLAPKQPTSSQHS